jgi:cyclopropane fatty-acyl-phospholipid synthase-like methyltransferase
VHLEELEEMYAGEAFYWGTEHNALAERAVEFAPDRPELRAVDLGAGEGRDAVYLADRGMDVVAVDVSTNGLAKARRLAADRGVELACVRGDVNTVGLAGPVDVLYSIGTIQYLRPSVRASQFAHWRRQTRPGGVHALFAFVDRAEIPPAPDWRAGEHLFDPGELAAYYDGWERCFERSVVFEDDSGGDPHRHAAEEVVVRKPD